MALEDFLGGLLGERERQQTRNMEEARQQNARESQIYSALLNSPDPEIASAALTGLLTGAQKPKKAKGLSGWFGEQQTNPMMGEILRLIQTPVAGEETVPVEPARAQGYIAAPPPGVGSAAQVPTSPTAKQPTPLTPTQPVPAGAGGAVAAPTLAETVDVVGTAPPRDLGPVQPDVRLIGAPPELTQKFPTMKPRQVFRTPEEEIMLGELAQGRAKTTAELERARAIGFSPEEYKALEQAKARRAAGGAAPFQFVAGEAYNAVTGKWEPTYANANRITGEWEDLQGNPITQFRRAPTATGAGYRFGVNREAIARAKYGMNYAELSSEQASDVLVEERAAAQEMSRQRALGTETGQFQGPIDVSTAQRTGTLPGTSSSQYAGQRIPTAQERTRQINAQTIKGQLNRILPHLAILPRASDLVGGVFPGSVMAARRTGRDTRDQVARLESEINNIRASLTRTMQGNVGPETERDAQRALSTLADFEGSLFDPRAGDTQESALARIQATMTYLDEVVKALPALPTPQAPGAAVGTAPPTGGAGGGAAAPAPGVGAGVTLDTAVPGLVIRNGKLVPQ